MDLPSDFKDWVVQAHHLRKAGRVVREPVPRTVVDQAPGCPAKVARWERWWAVKAGRARGLACRRGWAIRRWRIS